jgi:thiol:disulfide interchange protein DsbA
MGRARCATKTAKENTVSIKMAALSSLLLASPCFGDDSPLQLGRDYEAVRATQRTGAPAGRVEVTEYFQYGCGGCAQFEPHVEAWSGTKPEHVDLVRVPVVWNRLGELHARAFYAAEALGVLDAIHAPFFHAIHEERNRLDAEAKLRAFFVGFGVNAEAFDAAFTSFAVHAKVHHAKELTTRYGVAETPAIVVGGKYLTRGGLVQSYERWLEIVETLAERERPAP